MNEERKNQQAAAEPSLSEILQVRRDKLKALQDAGRDPFVQTRFERSAYSADIKNDFDAYDGKTLQAAGRIMSKRGMGKAIFCDIQDDRGQIQLYVRKDAVTEQEFADFRKYDIGDIIGVRGYAFKTKTGEISIHVQQITLLSKSLRPLPEKFHGMTNTELRYRQRYVDLIMNPESKRNFQIRSRFVAYLRRYLDGLGFMEVETPVLSPIAGGATARPFITHHNTLDIDMYMRIATELHLKRLIVGGLERVYEIGRIFRNEGMDPKHNPEFTTVELYQAYADFHDMMDIAEGVYTTFAQKYLGTYELNWMGETIDLTPGWPRLTMVDAVKQYVGVDFGAITDDAEAVAAAKAVGVELAEAAEKTWGNALYACFDQKVEEHLVQPTFITMYPVEVSPLAKRSPEDPHLTERYEMFVCGCEMGNAFSELNDPIDQYQRFKAQAEKRAHGDEEADKAHNHEAERQIEHRRSVVEEGVHRHQGEEADDDAVEPREDFDEHLFGAGRGMTVGDHHVDESRRHRHDDEQRDNAGQASEKTHFSSFLFGRHRRDALDTSARDCGSASVYEKGS